MKRSHAPALALFLIVACSRAAPAPPAAQAAPAEPGQVQPAYFEFQVTRMATLLPGQKAPVYPPDLRIARTQGEVLVQFVVDTAGLPEMASFKVLRSSHALFTESVRAAVANFRFSPAELNGHKVRVLVQQPMNFNLSPDQ